MFDCLIDWLIYWNGFPPFNDSSLIRMLLFDCNCNINTCSGRVLRRFPEARRELRQAVARGAAREGVLQLAKGLRWIKMARDAGLSASLPSKAQLGGTHITDNRYRQCVLCSYLMQPAKPTASKQRSGMV